MALRCAPLKPAADGCRSDRAQIAAYPAYLYKLRVQNKRAYYASEVRHAASLSAPLILPLTRTLTRPTQLAFVALLVNFGLSGYLILDKRYAGRTSIIGLLSNTFLCLGKVYGYRTCVPAAARWRCAVLRARVC